LINLIQVSDLGCIFGFGHIFICEKR